MLFCFFWSQSYEARWAWKRIKVFAMSNSQRKGGRGEGQAEGLEQRREEAEDREEFAIACWNIANIANSLMCLLRDSLCLPLCLSPSFFPSLLSRSLCLAAVSNSLACFVFKELPKLVSSARCLPRHQRHHLATLSSSSSSSSGNVFINVRIKITLLEQQQQQQQWRQQWQQQHNR